MLLKRINAVLGLLTILALLGHGGVMTVSLWTGWYHYILCKSLSRVTVILLFLHVVMTLGIFFFGHDGAVMGYPRLNRATRLQRDSAILILVLIHVHTRAYAHMATGAVLPGWKAVLFCVTEVLYFGAVLTHVAVSVSKAAVTLGLVSTERGLRAVDCTARVICALAMLAAAGGVISFFVGGLMG